MVRVGIVGIGFMGWIHWLAYQRSEGIEVGAIATRDAAKRRGDWTGIRGNFGPPGTQVDLEGVQAYEDLAKLVADPNIDVVDICLPPHMHYEAASLAFAHGKHVFCEKPLAVSLEDCDRLVAAAREADRQLLVGHVLPFFPEFAAARELVESGEFGRPIGGSFKRLISDPTWLSDFYDARQVGGPVVDLHVHDAHFIRALFGMPSGVTAVGRMRGEVVESFQAVFRFADSQVTVGATGGVINSQGRPFTHGFELQLERATLQFELAAFSDGQVEIMPLKILTADGEVRRPDLGPHDDIDGFVGEMSELRRAIETGEPSGLLGGSLARDAIAICHAVTQSVVTGGEVAVG